MDYDVAIVGAGPAGCSVALHLLRRRPRSRIALIDRGTLPREKPCGGAISRWGLEALEALDATPATLGVPFVPVRTLRVRHRASAVDHTEARSLGVVVERAVFDAALGREAERRGAQLLEGHRLVALPEPRHGEVGRRLILQRSSASAPVEVTASFVVGADGTGSAVRRLSGFDEPGPRARLIVLETDRAPNEDVDRGVLEFDLSCVERGIDGYVWHFATEFGGRRCVSRGIFDWRGRRAGDAHALRETLFDALRARGVDRTGARVKPYSERVFTRASAVASRSVLLTGEAAALVDPITGEGIAQAIVSGQLASDELDRALASDAIDPARYRAALSSLRCYGHLAKSAILAPHVYGRRASLFASAFVRTPAAVSAGADWYVGRRLGARRKVEVGAMFGWSLLRGALTFPAAPRE